MKTENKIHMTVFGIPVLIDYAEDRVTYPKGLSKEQLSKLSTYICDEGWMDDEFIEARHDSGK